MARTSSKTPGGVWADAFESLRVEAELHLPLATLRYLGVTLPHLIRHMQLNPVVLLIDEQVSSESLSEFFRLGQDLFLQSHKLMQIEFKDQEICKSAGCCSAANPADVVEAKFLIAHPVVQSPTFRMTIFPRIRNVQRSKTDMSPAQIRTLAKSLTPLDALFIGVVGTDCTKSPVVGLLQELDSPNSPERTRMLVTSFGCEFLNGVRYLLPNARVVGGGNEETTFGRAFALSAQFKVQPEALAPVKEAHAALCARVKGKLDPVLSACELLDKVLHDWKHSADWLKACVSYQDFETSYRAFTQSFVNLYVPLISNYTRFRTDFVSAVHLCFNKHKQTIRQRVEAGQKQLRLRQETLSRVPVHLVFCYQTRRYDEVDFVTAIREVVLDELCDPMSYQMVALEDDAFKDRSDLELFEKLFTQWPNLLPAH